SLFYYETCVHRVIHSFRTRRSSDLKQVQSLQERLKAQQERLKQLKADSEQTRFAEQKAELEYQQLAERLTDVKQLYQRLQASEGAQDDVALQEQKAKLEADLQAIAERKEALNLEIEQIKENKQATTQKVASLRQQLSQETLTERDLLSERKFESA